MMNYEGKENMMGMMSKMMQGDKPEQSRSIASLYQDKEVRKDK